MASLTISRKIALGFTALIAITGILGTLAVTSMSRVRTSSRVLAHEFMPEVDVCDNLQAHLAQAQLAIRSYGFTAESAYLDDTRKAMVAVHKDLESAQKLARDYPNLVRLRDDLGKILASLKTFEGAIAETEARALNIVQSRQKLDTSATDFITGIDQLIEGQKTRLQEEITAGAAAGPLLQRNQKLLLALEIRSLGNAARIGAFKAQALRDPAIFEDSLKNLELMESRFAELQGTLKVAADITELSRVKAAAAAYRDSVRSVMTDSIALTDIGKKRMAAAAAMLLLADEMASAGMKRTVEAAIDSEDRLSVSSTTILIGVASSLLVGFLVAFVIIRGTTRVLTGVATELSECSLQVTSAASQVAAASQSLAEGSSEQAAGLEETSASLEEVASMTKRNAEGAQQAKELSGLARASADSGTLHMREMRQAMDAIKGSSDDIAKIIKTIDEIAFQTNILALNAAVEAARAGEHGMGFAVVAEEVRALAQRSATAAKETAAKIEDSIRKSEHGVSISAKVATALADIVENARKVDALVAEIATASAEQNQGIAQVNTAISQMDQVTQGNASSAEEGAAAAEELSQQATSMQKAVTDLRALITHDAASRHPAAARRPSRPTPAAGDGAPDDLHFAPAAGRTG